ncbi:hypothetical protein Tco_1011253 [Tanacetum coccineum]
MLWKCASSTTIVLFEKNMQELKDFNKKAYEWLKKIHVEHWSRAYFSAHCDLLINNICEVFNRQLLEAKDSPIITALEHVREYLMKRIVVIQKIIEKCDGPLTPASKGGTSNAGTQASTGSPPEKNKEVCKLHKVHRLLPCEGACVFTDKWSLDELAYGVPTDGPYQTNTPSPDDIISFIRIDRECQVRRIRHEEEIDVLEYQILTRKIVPTLKPLEEIVSLNYIKSNKNVIGLRKSN